MVSVEFTAAEAGTWVHLTHTGFPNEWSRARHDDAWAVVLAQLDATTQGD